MHHAIEHARLLLRWNCGHAWTGDVRHSWDYVSSTTERALHCGNQQQIDIPAPATGSQNSADFNIVLNFLLKHFASLEVSVTGTSVLATCSPIIAWTLL